MNKQRKLEIWNKEKVWLLDIEKMRKKKISMDVEECAMELARFLLDHTRGDVLELLGKHIVSAIQYDHEYSQDKLNDDYNRLCSALYSAANYEG